ncbi:hypothetical protein BY458DRAFT_491121 [Sporodiniella umbellata]|nr:hypothetical protein BY458DRAFT_491121 [Sporodiniella umbellata]
MNRIMNELCLNREVMTNKRKPDESVDREEQSFEKKPRSWFNQRVDEGSVWSWLGYSQEKPAEEESMDHAMDLYNPTGQEPTENNEREIASEEKSIEPKQEPGKGKAASSWLSYAFGSTQASTVEETGQELSRAKNRVIPSFESQFTLIKTGNVFAKALNAIKSLFSGTPVDIVKHDMKGKKIVIIGVHGWFPVKWVRSLMGEPTGTSYKFCDQMKKATQSYFLTKHGVAIPDDAITTIPLLWEGKIQERVDRLIEQIKEKWIEQLQQADVILWATHSQGTPVSVILLRHLVDLGLIRPYEQPVCMLAMAGISHGPFPVFKGNPLVKYFEADAARELFDFMDSESEISKVYRDSMACILDHPIKMVLVGSMQDQMVPLYSAIMSGLSHPNLLRAVYIDGHAYSPNDFLIRLIGFCLQLLNLGLSDHGFLIYISEALAGNMYAIEGGHSTIYEELDVFTLSLQYLFEAYPLGLFYRPRSNPKAAIEKARIDRFQAKVKLNPFHLPWAMRGIWDDPKILRNIELRHELEQLQSLFDRWHPTSTKLKEIKFRLEPLKARL